MQTVIVDWFESVTKIDVWLNELPGRELLQGTVKRIEYFQIIPPLSHEGHSEWNVFVLCEIKPEASAITLGQEESLFKTVESGKIVQAHEL